MATTALSLLFVLFALSALTALPVVRRRGLLPEYWWAAALFGSKRQQKDAPSERRDASPISVIIAARNEAHNLSRCLPSVLNQVYPADFEVIVIDDASSDGTPDVLAFLQQKYPRLRRGRLSEKKMPGKKEALALGISLAQHDVLVFTDADCQAASSHWLSRLCASFDQNEKVELVLGYAPNDALPEKGKSSTWAAAFLNDWARFETAHTAFLYAGMVQAGMPYMGVGRNMAWRRPLWAKANGFAAHRHLPSGDDDLFVNAVANAENTALCFDNEAFVFSKAKTGWREWWQQKLRHVRTGSHYQPQHRVVLGAISLAHSGHYAALLWLSATGFAAWAWAIWVLRMVFVAWAWRRFLGVTKERGLLALLPIWDAGMGFYLGIMGLRLIFGNKRNAW